MSPEMLKNLTEEEKNKMKQFDKIMDYIDLIKNYFLKLKEKINEYVENIKIFLSKKYDEFKKTKYYEYMVTIGKNIMIIIDKLNEILQSIIKKILSIPFINKQINNFREYLEFIKESQNDISVNQNMNSNMNISNQNMMNINNKNKEIKEKEKEKSSNKNKSSSNKKKMNSFEEMMSMENNFAPGDLNRMPTPKEMEEMMKMMQMLNEFNKGMGPKK